MKVVIYSNDDEAIIIPLKLDESKKGNYFGENNRDIEEYDREVVRFNEGIIVRSRLNISGDGTFIV
jgi:hypothetical protein